MTDRIVHASTDDWEIVRYRKAGKWYAEWLNDHHPPGWIGPPHLGMFVNDAGRVSLTVRDAASAAVGIGAKIHAGRPGGSAFDRECVRDAEAAS